MEMKSKSAANSPNTAILELNGELDASNYLDVIDRVRQVYAGGARQLVLDLSNLSFLSSSGLVALHSAALIMRDEEPPDPALGWNTFHSVAADVGQGFETCCKLVNPQGRVKKTLEMTGFNTFLEVFDSTDEAVRSFLND